MPFIESEYARQFEDFDRIYTKLIEKVSRLAADDGETSTPLEGLLMYRFSSPNQPAPCVYDPHLGILLQGKKRVILGDELIEYEGLRFFVASLDLPVMTQVIEATDSKPYLALVLKLNLQLLRQVFFEFNPQVAEIVPAGMAVETGPVSGELLCAFSRLVDLLNTPRDIPALADLIQREILYRVLVSEQGIRLRQIALRGSKSDRTAKAIAWLKDNFANPLSLEDLAESVNMGVSTLHHHFRAMTGMSPLNYQKKLRLFEARRLMLSEGLDSGEVARRVGYESHSQYNREYRRLFGQPPVRDIKGLRLSVEDG